MGLILASKSPRRQELLRGMGLEFEVMLREVDETYPPGLAPAEVAVYIAEKKARAFHNEAIEDKLVLTADTIVVLEQEVLGKPAGRDEAARMLEKLSGKKHEVITGVALLIKGELITFSDKTAVRFARLSAEEICFYIDNYQPFDKAGAYGIQEWIGYNKISGIEGSYTNVVGLPTEKLYSYLSGLYPQALSSSGRM
ncbi:septum formation protein [Anseongella ginsenosidimutans]|uniref:dTTP/UTP pyrophosphatase n=1 Tax=Anseongella ginsenosidimutans TaxID=496056 RepID=A0A4R3KMY2_9SPHI|nr:Maf family nucleotide pyrophosphatase [Anseongella ginsenosidimutans]QEC52718.1 septum formation protein Maf [Anseongella ginsenosidimutans]TCS85467.1 septum formation protein [Anseongella ginsenosidimutans]